MFFGARYCPIIKTTSAEVRGYENLSDVVKNRILPIFELTRARTSKYDREGDISKRMSDLEKIVGRERYFFLDLTTHADLSNGQLDSLLDPTNGFQNWCEFLKDYCHLKIIPMVHAYIDENLADLALEARRLYAIFSKIGFRFAVTDGSIFQYISAINEGIGDIRDVAIVLDCGYIADDSDMIRLSGIVQRCIDEIFEVGCPNGIIVASSAFPKSVTEKPLGNDSFGEIPRLEKRFFDQVVVERKLSKFSNATLIFSDFASIHPYRYPTRGGNWVPRVDVPLDQFYIYTRYRRDDGGYTKAAGKMINNPAYNDLGAWGNRQISQAAIGQANGLSPAFWIGVRLNLHLTQSAALLPSLAKSF